MSEPHSPILKGQCACGKITFQSTDLPDHLDFCYCTTCQQVTGAPFCGWIGIKRNAITWNGKISKFRISDLAFRTFCSNCGGTLSMQYDCYPEKTHIAAGLVTQGGELIPKVCMHIFVRSKPTWYNIPEDGIPRYDEFDEEFWDVLKRYQTRAKGDGTRNEPPING